MNARSVPHLGLVYLLTASVAACSILYELILAQTLSELGGNTVIWYSLTVGLFIGAMGVGAYYAERLAAGRSAWETFIRVELWLAAAGGTAPVIIHVAHMLSSYELLDENYFSSFLIFGLSAVILISLVGLFSGIELPLLISIANERAQRSVTNRILAADYFGSLLGAVSFPLLLTSVAENTTLGFAVALFNAALGFVLLVPRLTRQRFNAAIAVLLCFVFVAGLVERENVTQYFLRKFYYYQYFCQGLGRLFSLGNETPRIERHRSAYQKIDIVEDYTGDNSNIVIDAYSAKFQKHPDFPRNKILFLNGERQIFSNFEELYHEYLAHVPIMAAGSVPRRVLIVGGGDGVLAKELLKYPEIEEIVLVDIDPTMVALARTHPFLLAMNDSALDNSRVRVIIGDGYEFARTSTESFDAVFADFPHPADYNSARLYSRELYYFIARRLSENGFLAFDADGIEALGFPDSFGRQEVGEANLWDSYYETVHAAGFAQIIPYFCNLEPENRRAMELVIRSGLIKPLPGAPPETMAMAARDFVQVHAFSLQSGFIMARKKDKTLAPWRDNNLELNVLNSDRYRRAFESPLRAPLKDSPELVNSVMRPTLPRTPFAMIKLPLFGGG